MRVSYDQHTDTLTFVLQEGARVAESDEERAGVILDFDEDGGVVSIEILEASRRVTDPRHVEFSQA